MCDYSHHHAQWTKHFCLIKPADLTRSLKTHAEAQKAVKDALKVEEDLKNWRVQGVAVKEAKRIAAALEAQRIAAGLRQVQQKAEAELQRRWFRSHIAMNLQGKSKSIFQYAHIENIRISR